MTATFYVGDAVTVMNTLPEKSVDLILSSPPFLSLRSYLPQGHPDKPLEGGSQSTPGEYVDWLIDVVEACARVLALHGSLCFELGDTFSGSGGAGGDYANDGLREGQPTFRQVAGTGWPLAKSLSLIPESFRWAMVYGHNPHTGRTTPPWRLRNVIRWVRPNPPVGALGDKFRPATSELMVFCKSKDRFFDLDAVREPFKPGTLERGGSTRPEGNKTNAPERGGGWSTLGPTDYRPMSSGGGGGAQSKDGGTVVGSQVRLPIRKETHSGAPPLDWWNIPLLDGDEETRYGPKLGPIGGGPAGKKAAGVGTGRTEEDAERWHSNLSVRTEHPAGSPPLDWWNIPPGGYPGAHYAVWPPELLVKPIKAMCPEKVCRRCGEARRRIVETSYIGAKSGRPYEPHVWASGIDDGQAAHSHKKPDEGARVVNETLGFSDCSHDDYRPGLVLDPFAGSGTTLAVATGHGRDAIGIDLDERNYELALERVGPLILQRGEIRDGTGPPD